MASFIHPPLSRRSELPVRAEVQAQLEEERRFSAELEKRLEEERIRREETERQQAYLMQYFAATHQHVFGSAMLSLPHRPPPSSRTGVDRSAALHDFAGGGTST